MSCLVTQVLLSLAFFEPYVVVGHRAAGWNKDPKCLFFVVRIVSWQTALSQRHTVSVLSICGLGQFIFLTEWLGQAAADQPSSGSDIWLDALLRAGQQMSSRTRSLVWLAGWRDAPTGQLLFLDPSFSYAVSLWNWNGGHLATTTGWLGVLKHCWRKIRHSRPGCSPTAWKPPQVHNQLHYQHLFRGYTCLSLPLAALYSGQLCIP